MVMKKATARVRKYNNQTYDRLVAPPKEIGPDGKERLGDEPRRVDDDGIVMVGEKITEGEIYLNKEMPKNTTDTMRSMAIPPDFYRKAISRFKGSGKEAYVDQVLLTSTESEGMMLKVLFRSTRRPELGDKFS